MWQLRQLCVLKSNRYSYKALRLELLLCDAKVNFNTTKHNVKSVCNPKVADPVMSWNTSHCGHIICVFINVLNIGWTVLTYFWTIFTHMLCSLEFKAEVEEKERIVTFGLNTAVSVFMAHQQGAMRRWEGVRPNYSSLTQHSEGMTSEKKAAGAREEQKTRHNDGRERSSERNSKSKRKRHE